MMRAWRAIAMFLGMYSAKITVIFTWLTVSLIETVGLPAFSPCRLCPFTHGLSCVAVARHHQLDVPGHHGRVRGLQSKYEADD